MVVGSASKLDFESSRVALFRQGQEHLVVGDRLGRFVKPAVRQAALKVRLGIDWLKLQQKAECRHGMAVVLE